MDKSFKNIFVFFILLLLFSCNEKSISRICNKVHCEEGQLINGEKGGVWKRYDKETNLIRISKYDKGVLNGAATSYYKGGQLYSVANYVDGEFHGNMSIFYSNGNINFSENFLYGKKDGFSYFFDEDGWLKTKWFYVSGKKNGNQYFFNKKGDTVKTEIFATGELLDSIMH